MNDILRILKELVSISACVSIGEYYAVVGC